MHTNVAALYVFLIGCALGLSVLFAPIALLGRLVALGGLLVFLLLVIWRNVNRERPLSIPFRAHPAILLPTTVIWVVFLVGLVRAPSPGALLHTGAFMLFSGVALFVVPAAVPRDRAFSAIAVLGSIAVLTSLPTIIWGDFTVFGYAFDQAGPPRSVAGIAFYPPTSIFTSRNYLRVLLAFGAICALALFVERRRPLMGGLCLMNVAGILLSIGRAATLALLAAVLLLCAYYVAGHVGLTGMTVVGAMGALATFGIAFGVLPGPETAIQAALGERIDDWTASATAFAERPLFGWGIVESHAAAERHYGDGFTGIHSSYIRLFVMSGIVGGIAYLALFAAALALAYRSVRRATPLASATYALIAMVLILQLFDGATLFGTNLSSVLWALAVGYTQSFDDGD